MGTRKIDAPWLYKVYLRYALLVLAWEVESAEGRLSDQGDIRRAVERCMDDLTHNDQIASKRTGWLRRVGYFVLDGGYITLKGIKALPGISDDPRDDVQRSKPQGPVH